MLYSMLSSAEGTTQICGRGTNVRATLEYVGLHGDRTPRGGV